MKNDLKTILYMGLGIISETGDKMKDIKDEMYNKGKELYEKGIIANEELKHNINKVMKDNVTVVNVSSDDSSKENILKNIEKLSDNDKEDILKALNKKGDAESENGKGRKDS